jgi:uncharacterized protein (TIGR03435 family)
LILSAYGLKEFQVVGYPDWVASDRFDIEAKSGEAAPAQSQTAASYAKLQARLQALLAERCKLFVRPATRSQVGWALTVDRRGPKMTAAEPGPKWVQYPFAFKADGITMAAFSAVLSNVVRGVVVDQTRLPGAYKVDFKWPRPTQTPETPSAFHGPDVHGIAVALREQLGLVLTREKVPVRILIVERIRKPSAN